MQISRLLFIRKRCVHYNGYFSSVQDKVSNEVRFSSTCACGVLLSIVTRMEIDVSFERVRSIITDIGTSWQVSLRKEMKQCRALGRRTSLNHLPRRYVTVFELWLQTDRLACASRLIKRSGNLPNTCTTFIRSLCAFRSAPRRLNSREDRHSAGV